MNLKHIRFNDNTSFSIESVWMSKYVCILEIESKEESDWLAATFLNDGNALLVYEYQFIFICTLFFTKLPPKFILIDSLFLKYADHHDISELKHIYIIRQHFEHYILTDLKWVSMIVHLGTKIQTLLQCDFFLQQIVCHICFGRLHSMDRLMT